MHSQVQLLVTSQDVENYKQIKSDLDQLRSIVEKSELWVYKRQGPDESMDASEGLSAEPDHKKVLWVVYQSTLINCFFLSEHFLLCYVLALLCRAIQVAQTSRKKRKVQVVTTTGW